MDTSDWLQVVDHEEGGMDNSSSPSSRGDMIGTCSRPMLERRLRPQHDQALKCPRCDSIYTKFCYYNNYSLSQPRYFCKTCRRYWTKGGSLRNIPVGGGCRKNNKRVSSSSSSSVKKSSSSSLTADLHHHHHQIHNNPHSSSNDTTTTDLHLSFSHDHSLQLSHFSTLFGGNSSSSTTGIELENLNNNNIMEKKYKQAILDNPIRQVDFMECTKYDNIMGNPSTNHDFMSGIISSNDDHLGNLLNGLGDHNSFNNNTTSNFNGLINPFAISLINGNNNEDQKSSMMMMNNSFQRLMLPFDHHPQDLLNEFDDMKPNKQLLSIDQWQDHNTNQECSEVGKDSFGYNNYNIHETWSSAANPMMNSYGSSQTNPLI